MYRPRMQFWTRNFFPTLTAALALVACGDNGGGTTTDAGSTTGAATSGASTGDSPTTAASTSGASDSGSTSADASTSGDPPSTSEPASSSGADGSTSNVTASSTDPGTTTGGDPVAACLMMIDPGDACGECACNNCLEDLQACQADEGCTAIRMCAQDNMCGGIDCLGPCGATIDKYGGLGGKSAQLGLALSGCIDGSCANECNG